MAGSVVIAVEGVLRSPTGQPLPEGVLLYNAFAPIVRVVLVLDDLDQDEAVHWLRTEGLKSHAELVLTDPRYQEAELRRHQLERARARSAVDLLIDPSPLNVAEALKLGISGLLFSQPRYLRPEFRPDVKGDIRRWDEVEAEVARQRDLHAADKRASEPEVVVTSPV